MKYFKQLLILLISVASIRSETEENSCSMSQQMDDLCGSYCYGIVKPLLRYAESVQSKEVHFKELTDIIRNLEATVETLKGQIKLGDSNQKCELRNMELVAANNRFTEQFQNLTIQKYSNEVELKKQLEIRDLEISKLTLEVSGKESIIVELVASKKGLVEQIQNLTITKGNNELELNRQINNQSLQISNLKSQFLEKETKVKELEKVLSETSQSLSSSCLGKPTGIYEIKLPGACPFSVPCDSDLTDPGWTVVQRRQYGSENFDHNWNDYRVGFGYLSGDFFIGLDKLYLMTKSQQHELKIYMTDYNNNVEYAQYSNFSIGGEETKFVLLSLGEYSGTAVNEMKYHLNMPFSTPDRDNSFDCVERKNSGWWFTKDCVGSNLNGRDIWWFRNTLKFVQMLIRPVKK